MSRRSKRIKRATDVARRGVGSGTSVRGEKHLNVDHIDLYTAEDISTLGPKLCDEISAQIRKNLRETSTDKELEESRERVKLLLKKHGITD